MKAKKGVYVLAWVLVACTPFFASASSFFEKLETGACLDTGIPTASGNPIAQTFTPSVSHRVTEISLYMKKFGSPGTATIALYATDSEGKPTGSALTSGTDDANVWSTSYAWHTVQVDGQNVIAGIEYAIIPTFSAGLYGTNVGRWCTVNSASAYLGGTLLFGDTDLNQDAYFREYGSAILFALGGSQEILSDAGTVTGDVFVSAWGWALVAVGIPLSFYLMQQLVGFFDRRRWRK